MNTNTQLTDDLKLRLQLTAQVISGLLASGHFTLPAGEDCDRPVASSMILSEEQAEELDCERVRYHVVGVAGLIVDQLILEELTLAARFPERLFPQKANA